MQDNEKLKCSGCGQEKPASNFRREENQRGLQHYCEKCRVAYQKAYSEKRKANGLCVSCGQNNDSDGFANCNLCRQRNRDWNQKLKLEAFNAYGGAVCKCCGETELRFLTIDHINNDGYKHRKEQGLGFRLYRWLRKNNYPDGFQVLCANCNFGKSRLGYCPHEIKKEIVLNWDKEGQITYSEAVVDHAQIP